MWQLPLHFCKGASERGRPPAQGCGHSPISVPPPAQAGAGCPSSRFVHLAATAWDLIQCSRTASGHDPDPMPLPPTTGTSLFLFSTGLVQISKMTSCNSNVLLTFSNWKYEKIVEVFAYFVIFLICGGKSYQETENTEKSKGGQPQCSQRHLLSSALFIYFLLLVFSPFHDVCSLSPSSSLPSPILMSSHTALLISYIHHLISIH